MGLDVSLSVFSNLSKIRFDIHRSEDLSEIIPYLKTDLWRIREKDLPRAKALLIRALRILILTFRGLTEDKAHLRASALTFYSLLSIVPVAAMAFGIAKGFGFERPLERALFENLQGQEEAARRIVEFSHALLNWIEPFVDAGEPRCAHCARSKLR